MVSFTPRSLYPQGKRPRYPLGRRLGGPQSRSGLVPTIIEIGLSIFSLVFLFLFFTSVSSWEAVLEIDVSPFVPRDHVNSFDSLWLSPLWKIYSTDSLRPESEFGSSFLCSVTSRGNIISTVSSQYALVYS
jgi:hypothetical protein